MAGGAAVGVLGGVAHGLGLTLLHRQAALRRDLKDRVSVGRDRPYVGRIHEERPDEGPAVVDRDGED